MTIFLHNHIRLVVALVIATALAIAIPSCHTRDHGDRGNGWFTPSGS